MNYFSIVIPVYNKGNYVATTIRSVLAQTETDFELIIVNDGSTDNSLQVIKTFQDRRIRIISIPNGGVSNARNIGIMESKGTYIAFLDADDIWDSNYLKTMKELIKDFPLASFWSSNCGYNIGGKITKVDLTQRRRGYIDNYFREIIKSPLGSTSSMVVKKKCFDYIGLYDTKLKRGEDIDIWIRLARNYLLAYEPELLVYYVIDAENRACLINFPNETRFLFHLNFKGISSDENRYLRHMIIRGIIDSLRSKNFRTVIDLIVKYRMKIIINFSKNILMGTFVAGLFLYLTYVHRLQHLV